MPKKKKGGSGSTQNSQGSHASQIGQVNQGFEQWNEQFNNWANQSVDYGQNNPFSQSAQGYVEGMLSGNAPNRWMDNLYGGLENINLNESFDYLRDFLGGKPGQGGPNRPGSSGRGASYFGFSAPGTGANVDIQDSSAGPNAFRDTAQWFLDRDARLNPEDDPTMQPYLDALRQEAEEVYSRNMSDVDNQAAGVNMWGGSKHDALRQFARDDFQENLNNANAEVIFGSRNNALQSMKEILGLANERDIAEGNIDAQLAAAGMNASAAGAGAAAAARNAEDQNRLQAIGMLLGGSQFGMGLKGDMAGLLQQGQQGALEAGIGYGNLGMSGYDRAANFGQLGLGALGALGGNINSYWNSVYGNQRAQEAQRFARERYENELPWMQADRMIDLLGGLGQLSGDYDTMPWIEQPDDYYGDSGLAAGLSGLGAGFGSYFNQRAQ